MTENNSTLNGWSEDIPSNAGQYWFYGDPYLGQMGSDFREDGPKLDTKLYYVEIIKISNGILAMANGSIISLRKFDKNARIDGILGYWQPINIPQFNKEDDINNLFGDQL